VLVEDSQFERAIEAFEDALLCLTRIPTHPHADPMRVSAMLNLGGAKIMNDDYEDGIEIIESVILEVDDAEWRADALLDLGLGYLNLDDFSTAEELARRALARVHARRQIRWQSSPRRGLHARNDGKRRTSTSTWWPASIPNSRTSSSS
jgi:tetratricopeptide (TPR) repeat protein